MDKGITCPVKFAEETLKMGINPVPLNKYKHPTVPSLNPFFSKPLNPKAIKSLFSGAYSVGYITGKVSDLFLLDFDLKNELSGKNVFEEFKKSAPKELLTKAVVVKTVNDGYHMWFRGCSDSNMQKLAMRRTTFEEKVVTYYDSLNSEKLRNLPLERRKKIAGNTAENDKSRVILETRENKSYGVSFFDPRYELIYAPEAGLLTTINREEYDQLIAIGKSLDRTYKNASKQDVFKNKEANSIVRRYNNYANVEELLFENGWDKTSETISEQRYLRPGQTSAKSSALFDKENRTFVCFSTSASLPHAKPMSAFDLLCELEFDGKKNQAFSKIENQVKNA